MTQATNEKQVLEAQTELRAIETPKMIAVEAMKSNKNFETFLSDTPVAIIAELAKYPAAEGKTVVQISELTQNKNSFFEIFSSSKYKNKKSLMIVWVVNSVREEILNAIQLMNERTDNNFGIFVFKADLKGDGMAFECVLKPEYKEKQAKVRGNEFNLEFWKKYYDIATARQSKIVAKPNDRQFKTISAGKSGISIMQTVSKEQLQLGSEIYIQDSKETYDKLFAKKAEIEKEIGSSLVWLRLDNKKASRIVKYIKADLLDNVKMQSAINEQIEMGEKLKEIVAKYL